MTGSLTDGQQRHVSTGRRLVNLKTTGLKTTFAKNCPIAKKFDHSLIGFATKTGANLTSVVATLLVTLIILFFAPLFCCLPRTALTTIVLITILGLLSFSDLGRL